MTKSEFQVDVLPRLMDLAEAFDRKPPSDAALRVWCDVLTPLPVRPVLLALQSWTRSKTKFPAPAEIFSAANDIDADDREQRIAAEKGREQVDLRRMGATPQGRRALRLIRDLIAKKVDAPHDPRAWARKILDRYVDGDKTVADIALRMACEATGHSVEEIAALRGQPT